MSRTKLSDGQGMSSMTHYLTDLVAGALSPAGRRARLSILIYHRVRPAPDEFRRGDPNRFEFEWQMSLLARYFNVLPLVEACDRLSDGTLPARAACITFDDGYADNETVALPILQRYGLSATFFVATSFLNGGRMWNDSVIEWARTVRAERIDLSDFGLDMVTPHSIEARREIYQGVIGAIKYLEPQERAQRVASLLARAPADLPDDLMMSSGQVRNLVEAGMEIGGHTHSHPILASLDPDAAAREIEDGKNRLEEIIDRPLRVFAYPNGKPVADYSQRDRDLVRSLGFEAAVSTRWGAADRSTDRFQLPRFTPWHPTPGRFHAALVQNYLRRERASGNRAARPATVGSSNGR